VALVGRRAARVLSGAEVAALCDAAPAVQVRPVDAFGRLALHQKSRIVRALQAGFLKYVRMGASPQFLATCCR
jgi:Mg2+-importing ATPase